MNWSEGNLNPAVCILTTLLGCFVYVCVCRQTCPQREYIHHCSCRRWAVSQTGLCLCAGSSTVSCCLAFRAFTLARWQHGVLKRWVNVTYLSVCWGTSLFLFNYHGNLCLCFRFSDSSKIWLAVKNRPVYLKKRWEHYNVMQKSHNFTCFSLLHIHPSTSARPLSVV